MLNSPRKIFSDRVDLRSLFAMGCECDNKISRQIKRRRSHKSSDIKLHEYSRGRQFLSSRLHNKKDIIHSKVMFMIIFLFRPYHHLSCLLQPLPHPFEPNTSRSLKVNVAEGGRKVEQMFA